ncbi:MAG: sugar phosphate isomerase/epimerase [Clostridiales bacterium]|jgi:sugar phosphate isomerase/epimerase|nr:sugar phosphate isomerase/epimerase [Clostridiales bacterium]
MRLGGTILMSYSSPQEWIEIVRKLRYSAVLAPVDHDAPDDLVKDYLKEAKKADVIIAEVGAWSNPISPDDKVRKAALEYCKKRLDLAERLGARCCVNTAGARGEIWDGVYRDNYSEDTYALIVDSVREIIDDVKPKNTFYALEPMPWIFPDSPDSYLRLIKDIDRKEFGVHLDFVNMINTPRKYLYNDVLIKECFEKLGPYIKSCHAKDVIMSNRLTTMIREVAPGKGVIDYTVFLKLVERLDPDMPVMLEHLDTQEEYIEAYNYIKGIADENNIRIKGVL